MNYREGRFGRVFLLRFDDGDDLLGEISGLAKKEDIRAASITLLGGLRSAGIVTGPREAIIPPEPVWLEFTDGREIVGMGTLFWKDDAPSIHLHGAIGRSDQAHVGCVRKDCTVYLVVEAVIAEISGIQARRAVDEKSGLAMLDLS